MADKSISKATPAWLKVAAYFLVIIAAACLASRFPVMDSIFFYFGIALVLSYLMLRAEGRSLLSLGFKPEDRLDLILIHFWSSFAQEFTYRGYPFQRLLKAYGPWIAQLVITLPFAIMHLKLNAPITSERLLMTWLTTGLGSILYGLCYLKTGKLILSIGLHMGWNLAQALVPRSPEESTTMFFHLVQDGRLYHPLYVLLPYVGITLVMMIFIYQSQPPARPFRLFPFR